MPTKGHSKTRLTWRLRIGHRHQISSRSPSGCRYFDLMAEPVHKVYQMFGGDEEAMDNAAMKYLPQARRGRTFQNRRFGWKNSCAERTGTGSAPVLRHPNHSSPLSICLKSVPERSKNTLAAVIQSSTMSIVEGGTLILAMKMRLVMRTPKANLLPPKHLPHCQGFVIHTVKRSCKVGIAMSALTTRMSEGRWMSMEILFMMGNISSAFIARQRMYDRSETLSWRTVK